MESFTVQTGSHDELIDITRDVVNAVNKIGATQGVCIVYTPHTTAAITINENADPDVPRDIIKGLRHLGFEKINFSHGEGNSPSHLKSSLVGCSEMVIIDNGRLQLGTWQGIFFCEFDGPRTRKVYITVL